MKNRKRRRFQRDLEWVERTGDNVWYWQQVDAIAKELHSDGCTGIPDFFSRACLEHDIHYRTHQTIFGTPITKDEADWIMKRRVQQWSWFREFSPMAQWRFWFLRGFVRKPWERGGKQRIKNYRLMA